MESSAEDAERPSEQSSRWWEHNHRQDHHHQYVHHNFAKIITINIINIVTINIMITLIIMVMRVCEEGSGYRQCCIPDPLHVSPQSEHYTSSPSSSSINPSTRWLCSAMHWNSFWRSGWQIFTQPSFSCLLFKLLESLPLTRIVSSIRSLFCNKHTQLM